MPRPIALRVLGVALAATLAVSACSSSGDDGSVIKVSLMGPITGPFEPAYGDLPALLDTVADEINANGGFQGKDLEFVYCDTAGDPAREAGCAREAVRENVVATLGIVTLAPDYVDVFEAADIPIIGPFGRHPVEFTAANSWPLTSGNVGLLSGATRLLLDNGAEDVQVVVSSSPGGALARSHMTAGFDAAGTEAAGVTLMPEGDSDASAIVAAATRSVDAVAMMTTTPSTTQYLAARSAVGDSTPTATGVINLPKALIGELGDSVEGIFLTSPVAPIDADNEGVAQLRETAEVAGLDPDAWAYPEYVTLVWANVQVFLAAAEQADDLTAQGIHDALAALQVDVGVIAPVDLTEARSDLYPGLERIFNNQMLFGVVDDGRFEPFELSWVDPSAPELAVTVP